jgi:hypothetical protein
MTLFTNSFTSVLFCKMSEVLSSFYFLSSRGEVPREKKWRQKLIHNYMTICPAVPNINVFHVALWHARHEANIKSDECKILLYIFRTWHCKKNIKKRSDSRIMSQSENNLYVYFRKIIITSNYINWEVKCISLLSSTFVVTKRQYCLFQFSPWCEIRKFFLYLTYL